MLAGGGEEVPSADQPSSWLPGSVRRSSVAPVREHQLLIHPGGRQGGDGGDLWKLEKTVEELKLKLLRLEEKTFNSSSVSAALQAEVTWLRRGLEEHLKMFKNVFSNADVLARSDATLELNKLWQLVRKKDKKRGGGGEASGGGGHRRSRRSAGEFLLQSVLPLLSTRHPTN